MAYNLLKNNEVIKNNLSKSLFIENEGLIIEEINRLIKDVNISEYVKNINNYLFLKSLFNLAIRYNAIKTLKVLNSYSILFYDESILKSLVTSGNINLLEKYIMKAKERMTENECLKFFDFMMKKDKIKELMVSFTILEDKISKIKLNLILSELLNKINNEKNKMSAYVLLVKSNKIREIMFDIIKGRVDYKKFSIFNVINMNKNIIEEDNLIYEKYFFGEKIEEVIPHELVEVCLSKLPYLKYFYEDLKKNKKSKKFKDILLKVDNINKCIINYGSKLDFNKFRVMEFLDKMPIELMDNIFDSDSLRNFVLDNKVNLSESYKLILEKYFLRNEMKSF